MSHAHFVRSLRSRTLSRCLGVALASCSLAPLRATPMFATHRDILVPKWIERVGTPRATNTVFVSNCNDAGNGSLREALLDASGETTIDLDLLTCSTITLTTGALVVPSGAGIVAIDRSPAYISGRRVPTLTIDANAAGRVIDDEDATAPLYLRGVTLQDATFSGDKGGCVYAAGPIYLDAVLVQYCRLTAPGNDAALGGAIYAKSRAVIDFSSITHSSADAPSGYAYGGGIFSAYSLDLQYSTIYGDFTIGGIGYGGGIAAHGGVALDFSLVAHNTASYDGGLALFGGATLPHGLSIDNSTIANNMALGNAGGIVANGELYVNSSTIAGNTGVGAGHASGIEMLSSQPLVLYDTIVANNQTAGAPLDIDGASVISGAHNLVIASSVSLPGGTISADPMLGPLADHGGQTMVMPLMPGSPAIDVGGANYSFQICDQRAGNFSYYFGFLTTFPRVVGSSIDIGAYEFGADDEIWLNGFDGPPEIPKHCTGV